MADIDIQAQIDASWQAAQQPLASRTIMFSTPITEATANDAIAHLLMLDRLSQQPIVLRIHSEGGQVYGGLALYDAMRHTQSPIITVADTVCGGNALHLLMAGTRRYALPSSELTYTTIRQPQGGMRSDIVILGREVERLAKILDGIVIRHTDRRGWLQRMFGEAKPPWDLTAQRTFTPQQAVDLHIVDAIIPSVDTIPG